MIGQLRGLLLAKEPPLLLIDVAGVGYEVFAPISTFSALPELNQPLTLLTHLVVREDAHILYGFAHREERELFRALIRVNGVGPKLALAILSGIEPLAFVDCVMRQDASSLIKIPGVGKKTAERLLMEMRDALLKWRLDSLMGDARGLTDRQDPQQQEAISALITLGYKPNEAKQAIAKIDQPCHNSAELIRLALKQMIR